MYVLQLPDGTESESLNEAQIRGWIATGRVQGDTPARKAWDHGWETLGHFPEFADVLAARANFGEGSHLPWCGLALLSAVLAPLLCLWLLVAAVEWPWSFSPALGLSTTLFVTLAYGGTAAGWFGLQRTRQRPRVMRGQALSRWGAILCGAASLAGTFIDYQIVRPMRTEYHARIHRDPRVLKFGNLPDRQLDALQLAAGMVQAGVASTNWCQEASDLGLTPAVNPDLRLSSMALNAQVIGRSFPALPPDVVTFFETARPGWNLTGGRELIATGRLARGKVAVALADGRAMMLTPAQAAGLRWKP